ncbi:carbohydrate ABC transporter membrane protein 1, CUT1 family [Planifilum fulgidum]|jgi:putative aldouronate transport system permease protein|uniref:Carbohydrate ABC transporter membrane protein 1, CUT1 family n=1 Tax=Planifilum fulgidum TaxID=201973 RepID=A0A1I2PJB5_9BACL|nr:ABC transporter permease subunit [Planifilum fulgidum]SFG16134.1 carbohydrate ABC transporter membrane protein 1, CUT1 family [Planifilum fulgidum]
MEIRKPTGTGPEIGRRVKAVKRRRTRPLYRHWHLYLLILPGLLYFLVYRYLPMFGLVMAFQDFSPFLGFFDSPWVGLKHFRTMFEDEEALRVIWNTLEISLLQILFAFPLPIILALMINELRNAVYKRLIQSMVYLPHFLSWVVVVGIFVVFLKSDGIVNQLLQALGIGQIPFLTSPEWFKPLIVFQVIWKESGWGTIIILAALAGVNPQLYEAAVIDGANRWQQMWHITLPAIRSTIVILLILRLGSVMDTGFEQIFLMLNPFTMEVGNVLDTYVYFKGIQQGDISFATAVGLFKGAVGLILVVIANRLAKRFGEGGIY